MKKIYLLLVLFFAFSQVSFGQHWTESFENPDVWSSYTTGTVTFDSGAWEFVSVYPEAASASFDGSKACRINDDVTNASIVSPAVDGIGSISFYYHRPFTGTGTFSLEKNVNGVGWVELTTQNFDAVTTPTQFNYDVNDANNNIQIRIVNDNNTAHLTIDLFVMGIYGAVADPEPTNHVTSFSATDNGHNQVDLSWTDNDGAQPASGFLVLANTTGTFTDPVDGIAQSDDTDMNDNLGAKNVSSGVGLYSFVGLNETTTYYFKIFPYTNSGTSIDYKTDGTVPEGNATTDAAPSVPNLVISEIMQNPLLVTDANGEWFEIYNPETVVVNINGYTIKDDGSDNHTIDNGGVLNIPSEGFIVLGINSDNETNGGLTVNYVYGDFELANGYDEVVLVYTDGTTEVDRVNYDDGSNFPDPNGASMFLTNMTLDNTIGSNWTTASKREGTYTGPGDDGSPGTLGTDAALPVELTSFSASALAKGVLLNWSTATEVNNYGFDVEKQSSGNWVKVGFVDGHGNSNSPNDYSFVDSSPAIGEVSYRLKQIDTDGAFEYSDAVSVTSVNLAKNELLQNHPNPFNPSTAISFSLAELAHVSITVYNAIGQKVAELANEQMDAGFHNVNFDGSNLSSGMYFYRLETANYSKTMKMILLR